MSERNIELSKANDLLLEEKFNGQISSKIAVHKQFHLVKSALDNARGMRSLVETVIKRQSYRLIKKSSKSKEDFF